MENSRDDAITFIMDFIQRGNCDINFANGKYIESKDLDFGKFYIVLLTGKFRKYQVFESFVKKGNKRTLDDREISFNFPDLDKYDIYKDEVE